MSSAPTLAAFRLDPDHTKVALKTCTAMAITLGVAFALEWTALLGAITVMMLQLRALGGLAERGSLRMIGGLTAGLVAFVILAELGQEYGRLVAVLSLWVALCTFLMQGDRFWYFWIISLAYSILVTLGSVQDPTAEAFSWAVTVASTVALGAASVWLVGVVLWPRTAQAALERARGKALDDVRRLVELDGALVLDDDADPSERSGLRRGLFLSLPKLRQLMASAIWESSRFRHDDGNHPRALERFLDVAALVVNRGESLAACAASASAKRMIRGSESFPRAADELGRRFAALREDRVDEPFLGEVEAVEIAPGSDVEDFELIRAMEATTRRLADGLEELRAALRRIAHPHSERGGGPAPAAAPRPPVSVRLRKALIAGTITVAAALTWRYLDWPGDFKIVIFGAVIGALNALAPSLPARSILLGNVLGIAAGAVAYFLIFPSIEGHFLLFVLVFFLFMFPFCYFKDSDRPTTALTGFLGAWSLLEILSPENSQTVSFSDFASTSFGLLGFGFGLAIIWLFTPHVPEHELRMQVRNFFATCEKALRDLGNAASDSDRASRIARLRHGLVGLLGSCGLWASLLGYKVVKANDRGKVGGLMATMHALAFRIECLERACVEPGSTGGVALADALGRLRVAAERAEPVGALPDLTESNLGVEGRREADDVQALVIAGHLRAVAHEIEDCRARYDAIDWASWDHDRF